MQTRSHSGFTLLELMIVVAIVGVLAAIAFPAFTQYVTKSRRAASEACLANIASYMERYYATNMSYTGAAVPALDCTSASNTGTYYAYTISATTSSTYTLTATPLVSQLKNDTSCGVINLSSTGQHTFGGSGAVTTCWAN